MTGTRQRLLAVKTASTDGATIRLVVPHTVEVEQWTRYEVAWQRWWVET